MDLLIYAVVDRDGKYLTKGGSFSKHNPRVFTSLKGLKNCIRRSDTCKMYKADLEIVKYELVEIEREPLENFM